MSQILMDGRSTIRLKQKKISDFYVDFWCYYFVPEIDHQLRKPRPTLKSQMTSQDFCDIIFFSEIDTYRIKIKSLPQKFDNEECVNEYFTDRWGELLKMMKYT